MGRMEQAGIFGSKPSQPVIYKVQVTTGQGLLAGTFDSIFITLVGTNGESSKYPLNQAGTTCIQGSVSRVFKTTRRVVELEVGSWKVDATQMFISGKC